MISWKCLLGATYLVGLFGIFIWTLIWWLFPLLVSVVLAFRYDLIGSIYVSDRNFYNLFALTIFRDSDFQKLDQDLILNLFGFLAWNSKRVPCCHISVFYVANEPSCEKAVWRICQQLLVWVVYIITMVVLFEIVHKLSFFLLNSCKLTILFMICCLKWSSLRPWK